VSETGFCHGPLAGGRVAGSLEVEELEDELVAGEVDGGQTDGTRHLQQGAAHTVWGLQRAYLGETEGVDVEPA
jgi:hypothetical protein